MKKVIAIVLLGVCALGCSTVNAGGGPPESRGSGILAIMQSFETGRFRSDPPRRGASYGFNVTGRAPALQGDRIVRVEKSHTPGGTYRYNDRHRSRENQHRHSHH